MKKLLYIIVILMAVIGCVSAFRAIVGKSNVNKTLVAYFSATGNTKSVAEKLAKAIDADLFQIEPEQIYTSEDLNWRNDKSRSSVEMADKNSRPVIVSKIDNIEQYKIIFLGFPIWWGREPSIIDTFLQSYNWSGKTIIPFVTSGSTPTTDEAVANIRLIVPNINILNAKRFTTDVSDNELKIWAEEQM